MNLRICLSEATSLQSFMERSSGRNIQSIRFFQIFIGCQNSKHPEIPDFVKYERYIKYCNGAGSNFPTLDVFARANAFELVNHKDIKHLSDFGIASMKKVLGCLVESCDAIETIVGTVDSAEPVLPNLEGLYIKNLPRLESIFPCLTLVSPESIDLAMRLLSEDGRMSFRNPAALDPFRLRSFAKNT
ncbi:hypothetical protein LOK49_LG02G02672 [Camellia lanceoleosa]|uniref:Uncharacterized protein n=1 Tax=Camellia lanceoleosa TaxID=1840588 RepID=A0ACC0IR16_9ERIC|nr:hypothetical protein LOK49_LG02G02672 [Camellia lanceoleosa]